MFRKLTSLALTLLVGLTVLAACEEKPKEAIPQTPITDTTVVLRIWAGFATLDPSPTITVFNDGHFIKNVYAGPNGHPTMPIKYQGKLTQVEFSRLVSNAEGFGFGGRGLYCIDKIPEFDNAVFGTVQFRTAVVQFASCGLGGGGIIEITDITTLVRDLGSSTSGNKPTLDEPLSLYASSGMALYAKTATADANTVPWPFAHPNGLSETTPVSTRAFTLQCYTVTGFDFLYAWLNGLLAKPAQSYTLGSGEVVTMAYHPLEPDEHNCSDVKISPRF